MVFPFDFLTAFNAHNNLAIMKASAYKAVDILKSVWVMGFSLVALAGYLVAAVSSLGLDPATVTRQFYPMQARYIDFFGLTNPLHSFFFWAIVCVMGVSIMLRALDQGVPWWRTTLLMIVMVSGSVAMLWVSRPTGDTSAVTVDFGDQGMLDMSPDSVYRLPDGSNVIVKLTAAGPLVLKKHKNSITASLPTVQGNGGGIMVRMCSPPSVQTSVAALVAGGIALLALFGFMGAGVWGKGT